MDTMDTYKIVLLEMYKTAVSAAAAALTVLLLAVVINLEIKIPKLNFLVGSHDATTIVVVGGGLAGHSAALSALEACQGCSVVVLDREPRLGGNSAKASSGINAVTPPQGDTPERFMEDTLRSGGGLSQPALVTALVEDSQPALDWIGSGGSLDLSGTVQLGGHSCSRTHFPPKGPVGHSIISAMTKKIEERPDRVRVLTGRQVGGGAEEELPAGAVILATGGFGANKDLLRKHAPHAADLPTTNGEFARGEGLSLAQAAGAALVDLEHVQVHPTGFVDPGNPGSHSKFLAPEKLRGTGGILLNAHGHRFTDELATREVVSAAMMQQPGQQAFVLLGDSSAQQFGPALEFYVGKRLMSRAANWQAAAELMDVDPAELAAELEKYNRAAEAGRDSFGKSVFPATIELAGQFYVGRVTPAIHYTMGGVRIDSDGRVLSGAGEPVPGLFAAGEVSGGVHGKNRLGGNSLLE